MKRKRAEQVGSETGAPTKLVSTARAVGHLPRPAGERLMNTVSGPMPGAVGHEAGRETQMIWFATPALNRVVGGFTD